MLDRLVGEDPSISDDQVVAILKTWPDDVDVLYWLIVMLLYRGAFVGAPLVEQIAHAARDEQLANVAFLFCVRAGVWKDVSDWPENAAIEAATRSLGVYFATEGAEDGIAFGSDTTSRSRMSAAVRWGPSSLRARSREAVLAQLVDEEDRGVRSVMVETVRYLST